MSKLSEQLAAAVLAAQTSTETQKFLSEQATAAAILAASQPIQAAGDSAVAEIETAGKAAVASAVASLAGTNVVVALKGGRIAQGLVQSVFESRCHPGTMK